MRLGLDCAHHEAWMVPGTGYGCLSPELKGTQAGYKANPGSFQSLGSFYLCLFPVVVVPKHLGLFCLKILLFSNSTALTGSLREAKGHRGAGGLAVRRLCTLSTLKSPKMQPKPLWAHTPCVCECVCVLRPAVSVQTVPIQLESTHPKLPLWRG